MGANEMVTYLEALQKQVAEVKKAIWKLPFSTRALSEIDATLDVHALQFHHGVFFQLRSAQM